MKCSVCGTTYNKTKLCPTCWDGSPDEDKSEDKETKSYAIPNIIFLVLNVLTICFCCVFETPFILITILVAGSLAASITGVVYSDKVNKMINAGNHKDAMGLSKVAKKLFYIAMILFAIKFAVLIVSFSIYVSLEGGFEQWYSKINNLFHKYYFYPNFF